MRHIAHENRTIYGPSTMIIALLFIMSICVAGFIYGMGCTEVSNLYSAYSAAKEAYNKVVKDLAETQTARYNEEQKALASDKEYQRRKLIRDGIKTRLDQAVKDLEDAKKAKDRAETAVASHKQLIKNIKSYLKTLSPSHPDRDDWEQSLHSAEYELDDKEDALKEAKKTVREKTDEVPAEEYRSKAAWTNKEKIKRDVARSRAKRHHKRELELIKKEKALKADMELKHEQFLEMDARIEAEEGDGG